MLENVQKSVPMLDLRAQHLAISAEIEAAIGNVFQNQQFILGPEVRELEKEIAHYCQSSYAIGCASGSDALLLALMACGVGPGDEVVTTSFSFFATAGSIVRLGARPVFVDIDERTFNMDPARLGEAINARTRAIMPVHLFGQCADMEEILGIAGAAGIAVIEDAAQAIGAEYQEKRAGSLGRIGAFSFYPSKNLGGAGDGGMLTTDDAELADRLKSYRAHGAKTKYYHDVVGINSRLDSLQAAILRVKLRYLDRWAEERRANAARYRTYFTEAGVTGDGLVRLPAEIANGKHVYNQFVIRAVDRDRLRDHMRENGIGTEIYYPVPLHLQACFADLRYKIGDLPISETAAGDALAIPIYPELGAEAQEYIVGVIAGFYR